MKKICFLVNFFCLFFCNLAFSSDWIFSINPKFNLGYGNANEYVFDTNLGHSTPITPENYYELSLLTWDIQNSIEIGCDIEFGYKYFISDFSFCIGLPSKSGYMQDYDWLSIYTDYLTNYSIHDNKITKNYYLNFKLGAYIPLLSEKIILQPMTGIKYDRIKFSAFDGYYQYVSDPENSTIPWTSNIPKMEMTGELIRYEVESFFIDFSFKFTWNINSFVSFSTTISALPTIFITALDNHIERNTYFLDHNMKGAVDFFASTEFDFYFTKKQAITIQGHFEYLPLVSGKSYSKSSYSSSYSLSASSLGGYSKTQWGFSLGWKFKI